MKEGHRRIIPPMGALFLALALLGPSPAAGQASLEAACNEAGASPAQIECFLKAAEAALDAGICTAAAEPAVRFNCLALSACDDLRGSRQPARIDQMAQPRAACFAQGP